jgi:hypothetical protein
LPERNVWKCPGCRKKSLFLNEVTGLRECVNRKAHRIRYFAQSDKALWRNLLNDNTVFQEPPG